MIRNTWKPTQIEPFDRSAIKPIVLPFADDSTLFFALRMRKLLASTHPNYPVHMAWLTDDNALSYRQLAQHLPEGPDRVIRDKADLKRLMLSDKIAAILVSRVFRTMGLLLKDPAYRYRAHRPCIISFLGGLDFTPELGCKRRLHCDGVFLFPRRVLRQYEQNYSPELHGWQKAGFGHPTFLAPKVQPRSDKGDVYFFAQALSPSTKRSRIFMLQALAVIARNNPHRSVWIKLRHLPSENKAHLHKERHDYLSLLKRLSHVPQNLKITACSMDEALKNAGIGITCTSTAAIDLLREGIPTLVYLDYVSNYCDQLVKPMQALFTGSNLITSTKDLLALKHEPVSEKWMQDFFCDESLTHQLFSLIEDFNQRPFQLRAS